MPTTQPAAGAVTAVVPARNAEALLPACLDSLRESGVAQIIVVDGRSTDGSREVAERYGATVVSDEGRGLPFARSLGIATATHAVGAAGGRRRGVPRREHWTSCWPSTTPAAMTPCRPAWRA